MNERQPESTELDDHTDNQVNYLMDTLGISFAEAQNRLGIRDDNEPRFTRAESRRLHPSNVRSSRNYESRYDGEMATGIHLNAPDERSPEERIEQAEINMRGWALVQEVLRPMRPEPSPQQLAIDRARQERRRQDRNRSSD